jgi:hypothetical protein
MVVRPVTYRRSAGVLASLALLATACSGEPGPTGGPLAPGTPPAAVCDRVPPGPATPPPGAVEVDPSVVGDLAAKTGDSPAGTTFWLAPGRHLLAPDEFGQVAAKDGNTYVGAPGAVLDGRGINRYAFTTEATRVTIRHLTVRGFVAPAQEGVVNHDSGDDWLIEYNTIEDNRGAALMAGARQVVRANCLRANGQYAMNAAQAADGIVGLVVEGNEITGNNADDTEAQFDGGCGCSGGIKFWSVNGADVRGNWVHDNRGPGLWADSNNNDFVIENNLIENNDGQAVFYETSYNAIIRNNVIRRNSWVSGKKFAERKDGFPEATIYISESGGEPRIPARTDKIEIYGNLLQDNWSGITLWENADRFCNSPGNTSTGMCTRLVPDLAACAQPGIATPPLYDDCRWKTQRVDIHHNRFEVDPAKIGCALPCSVMAVLANSGSYPEWSPYQGDVVRRAITSRQANRWHDNTYVGPWTFMPTSTDGYVDPAGWQSGPLRQDPNSTFVP